VPVSIRLTIPVTPPGTMGTTRGGHIYVEAPDQSATPAARMDGSTLMDGSATMQGQWSPIDLGKVPYVAGEQPWVVLAGDLGLNSNVANTIRVYVSSYSDDMDLPLVRYGSPGATPSYVVTIPAQTQAGVPKPLSGSNITPFLVTGISGAVSAAVAVGGKLRRPIGITVDLSGLPTGTPADWAYQLQGYVNGDLTQTPVLVSGLMTVDGLIPAGPDGITIPHTFGPEEPAAITSITVYAVAGLIAGSRLPGARGTFAVSTEFSPNNIIQGITASCVVSIGTVGGVVDPTAFVQSLLDTSVGVVGAIFGVLPLGIDAARIALLAVDTTKLAALAVTAAQLATGAVTTGKLGALAVDAAALATSAVTSTKIGNLAVGTAAIASAAITSGQIGSLAVGSAAIQSGAIATAMIQNAAITNALIANLAVGTAQIQNLAVGSAQISSLDVSKLNAGTIAVAVSLTSPTIVVTGSGYTINLDSTNGFKMTKSGGAGAVTISGATGNLIQIFDGTNVTNIIPSGLTVQPAAGSPQGSIGPTSVAVSDAGFVRTTAFGATGFIFVGTAGGTVPPFTGTLAAAIAAGKSVQGGIII
jgi:hypothetical protein